MRFDVEEHNRMAVAAHLCLPRRQPDDPVGPGFKKSSTMNRKTPFHGGYESFAGKARRPSRFVDFLILAAGEARRFAVTARLERGDALHYCGIGKDLIEFTVDRSPTNRGVTYPGAAYRSIIPIVSARQSRIIL